MSIKSKLLAVVFLVLIAAPPRFLNLGDLSFYGDEETSSIPTRALADGVGARMPTGMEYRRSLPLLYVNAFVARVAGLESEASYRLSSATLGTISVPLLYLTGASLVSPAAAFTAAIGLAVSEWHVVFSRLARMYAPLLFFIVLSMWGLQNWATGKFRSWYWLIPVAGIYSVTVSLHALGVFTSLFVVAPLLIPGFAARSKISLLVVFGALAAGAYSYSHFFVQAAYDLDAGQRLVRPGSISTAGTLITIGSHPIGPVQAGLAGLGVLVGSWLGFVTKPTDCRDGVSLRSIAWIVLAAIAGAMSYSGNIFGVGLAVAVAILMKPAFSQSRHLIPAVLATMLPMVIWTGYTLFLSEQTGNALRTLLDFPFPYLGILFLVSPGFMILFGAFLVWSVFSRRQEYDDARAIAIAIIVATAIMGVARAWGGARYVFPLYPALLLVASEMLVVLSQVLCRWARLPESKIAVPTLAGFIAVSGILGTEGFVPAYRQIALEHGDEVNPRIHMYPIRPDHRSAGRFVKANRMPGDIIIAEDPLEQYWYTGSQIDYWLRSPDDARTFLYQDRAGTLRDIYVGSELVSNPSTVEQEEARVWLITSAETYHDRDYYLSVNQRTWLESVEEAFEPYFVAEDEITRVYCINCTSPESLNGPSR